MASIMALDVGTVRVGVARADTIARIATPLATVPRDEHFWGRLQELIDAEEAVEMIVVGLPRNLNGDDTAQTRHVRRFAAELGTKTTVPWVFQDEALTSKKAEDALRTAKRPYTKADIDAFAARYILDDYLVTRQRSYDNA